MYVCVCNAITERDIRGAVTLGAASVDDLKATLGVATCCGRCEESARQLLCNADADAHEHGGAGD